MRCHICDRPLSDSEVQTCPSGSGFEPCTTCMDIALDAAYCDGFVKEDLDEVEVLDGDDHVTELDEQWVLDDPTFSDI